MENSLDLLRDLIAHDEMELAIEQLTALSKGTATPEVYREVIVQAGRLTRLRKQERRGLVSMDHASRERSHIADALLQLVDELSSRTTAAERPFLTPSVTLTPPANSSLEQIIGANNLKSIAWLQKAIAVANSVCRVVTPRGLGSGFLIAPSCVMTNHHVLSQPDVASQSYVEFNFQEDLFGDLQEPSRYRLLGEGFFADPELDFCIVRVKSHHSLPELKTWGTLMLSADPPPEVGEHVSIIQHPGGGAKQIALTANQVVNIFDYRLQYTTDTLPGSSGSPVFNDDWKVVALHRAGGNLVTNQRGDRMFANEGVLMARILERLSSFPGFALP